MFGGFKGIRSTSTGFKVLSGKQPKGFDKVVHYIASFVDTLHARSKATYSSRGIGIYTLLIQSLALLEVVHSALGFVRSPLQTTAMQVASRLLVVWWFVESEPSARTSGWYTSMIGAWASAEILRSSYYLASLLQLLPPRADANRATAIALNVLTYIRYTAFYVLYPLGAGSEWMILLKGFPTYPSKAATLAGSAGWKILKSGRGAPAWRVTFESFKYWIASFDAQAWLRVPFVFIWPASKWSLFPLILRIPLVRLLTVRLQVFMFS
jgi:very-long-chain (3R)-3-hydroxyacyl-CoA dehydratase